MNRPDIPESKFSKLITSALGYLGVEVNPPPTNQQKLSSATTGFAFNLLKQIAQNQPATNICLSPYSASTLLLLVCTGASGQTHQEMAQVLGTNDLSEDVLTEAICDIAQALNRNSRIILTTANALWFRKDKELRPEFIQQNQHYFGATIESVDFTDQDSIDHINAWAHEKTRGKITHITNGIDPATEMFLANAVYFNGKWHDPFDINQTKDRVFHMLNGSQIIVPMMEKTSMFSYRHGKDHQAVRLPYQGWNLSMYVILPKIGSSPNQLLSSMIGETWQNSVKSSFSERSGTIALPRFLLQCDIDLKKSLQLLGMKSAFAAADFSRMSLDPLFISTVRQQTFLEVNEEGTEAAVVTSITEDGCLCRSDTSKPFQMIVDRPFLFLIEDQPTRTILFMGIVFDPSAA